VNASTKYWAPEHDKGKKTYRPRERTVSHGADE